MGQIIRNQAAYPGFASGLRVNSGELTNTDSGAHDYTFETKCITILLAIAFNNSGGTIILPTIADSTANIGTKKITIAVPATGGCKYLVIGVGEDLVDDTVEIDADTVTTFVD